MNSSNHEKIIGYMHEYLDEDISLDHEQELREHLQSCEACSKHFLELKKAIAFVQSTSHIHAPPGFTDRVMRNLPTEKKQVGFKRWLGKHPFLTAAVVFLTLMSVGFFASWNADDNFSVSKHPEIIIENNTAVVPEGVTIKGDIVVKNGDILVEGKVEGDLTVINGEVIRKETNSGDKYMASAGEVTGDIEEINELFEWLWFQLKGLFK